MNALALLVALALDRWWGEPRARLHPVVWMGNYLGWAGRHLQRNARQTSPAAADIKAFWLGAFYWLAGAAVVGVAAWTLQQAAVTLPRWLGPVPGGLLAAPLLGLLLKLMLAWAMLKNEVLAVEQALRPELGGSLAGGRARLSWLVSRDVTELSESQVRESAIESLAENLNDSVVAPLFWFVLLGLPGAALYRFANTADAMWGYRGVYKGQNWEWAGKWAARADDVLSWLPARITAVLLWGVGGGAGWTALRTEAARTPSPNSGWPMASMALALGVCLRKPGVYALNAGGRSPQSHDTTRAIGYAAQALLVLAGMASLAAVLIAVGGPT
ncbi:adenosylcobinamide-phosphate synthase CbiB [Hydrogenophaga sp.]|uniref:adenosylcobinamide-phosphate synthase CbiB n=1 Tax=Hydrogenophaga sp. TaxID=1904254 RepID=UPI002736BE42|nr:adenosylcobinamide-phosphate synthase CbiB [Hydrogenophaga sp.]MDP3323664.1 adenosylcobinamide-phosphate synthase CbiB [Hydrogenophaga sp.]MDP3883459.1 adenosylcobinamide-phosphate synthase CbiB [Hydrogenophaga sp.]